VLPVKPGGRSSLLGRTQPRQRVSVPLPVIFNSQGLQARSARKEATSPRPSRALSTRHGASSDSALRRDGRISQKEDKECF